MPDTPGGSNRGVASPRPASNDGCSMSEVKPPPTAPPVASPDVSGAAEGLHPDNGAPRPAEPTVETAFGLSDGDRRVLSVLISVAVLLMVVHWYRLSFVRPAPLEILHPEGYQFQLDVNEATWVEWMQLEGIGEILARRIVADREQHGPFASIEDVQRVKGIGPKTLQKLRPHLLWRRDDRRSDE